MNDDCPFCTFAPTRIIANDDLTIVIRDAYPISPGHSLVLPRRHIVSFFQTTEEEQFALLRAIWKTKVEIDSTFHPDGYNIGINDGAAAGQTVMHLHIHLIPRHKGDSSDPRGGVRWIFPGKAAYWKGKI